MNQIVNEIWKNKSFRIGLILFPLVIFFSFLIPIFSEINPNSQDLENCFQKPNIQYLFGTDNLGRDIFLRILYGSRLSLQISFFSSFFSITIGLIIGVISGMGSKSIDFFLMRITDIFLGFPKYFLFILVLGFGQFSMTKIVIVLSLFSWMETAKMIRGETKYLYSSLYVKTAICQGLSKFKIFIIHLFPGLLGILISSFTLLVSTIILVESGISFIGLGVQSPAISLGTILNQARYFPMNNYSLIIFTGLFILLNVSTFHFLGDGIKESLIQKKFQK